MFINKFAWDGILGARDVNKDRSKVLFILLSLELQEKADIIQ